MSLRSIRWAALGGALCLLAISACPGQNQGSCGTCDSNAVCDAASKACVCVEGFVGSGKTCSPIQCPALTVENGTVTPAGEVGYRGVATYGCDQGYKRVGEATRRCQADRTWSDVAPTCVKLVNGCDEKPCIHGSCDPTGDSGGYSCGSCEAGWTGANCDQPVTCPSLADPTNGSVTPKTATAGGAATYSCQAGYALAGEASRACQNDGTWAGAAPTCAAIPCYPDLSAPAHGSVSASTGVTGDVVTYSCESGYQLAGNATRLCQTDGTWSGTDPSCSATQDGCSSSPCLHGACTPSGASDFTCACTAGWSGARCDSAVTCSGAAAPAHGGVSAASASYGGSVSYSCDPGYSLSGSATRLCQADGSFAGAAPTCVVNACAPDLTAPAHGSVSVSIGFTGDVATYGCDAGYALSGATTRVCQTDGSWSGAPPACVLIQTGCVSNPCQNAGQCTPAGASGFTCACPAGWTGATCATAVTCAGATAPAHGSVSAASAGYDASIIYSCDPGYSLSGSATRACGADGSFAGSAPTCAANACAPNLAAPTNGSVSLSQGFTGDVATYGCDLGFALSGTATRLCQTDGTWSGAAPTCALVQTGCSPDPCQHGGLCTPSGGSGFSCACTSGWTGATCASAVTCSGATAPSHGAVSAASTTYGLSVTYSCDAGYSLSGPATRLCQADGAFAGTAPSCAANACAPDLVSPANGSVTATTGVTGDVVTYSCDGGYSLVGEATRTCQANGTWTGAAPTCALVTTGCSPNPCLHSASCTPVGPTGYSCGTCDPGWSGANCGTPITCTGAVAPSHGSVSAGSATYGQSVTYACDAGYERSGVASRTCQANGTFSDAAPDCNPVDCGAAPSVTNAGAAAVSGGAAGGTSTTFGATAAYSCNAGYAKNGSDATCGADGTWTVAPTCTLVNCGAPPFVSDAGSPSVSGGLGGDASPTYGATASYSCNAGYAKSGQDSSCGQNGSWSTPPTCTMIDCGSPPAVSHAAAPAVSGGMGGGSSTTYNATATYTCDTGYAKTGSNPTCGTLGWSSAPTCTLVICPAPPTVTNAGPPAVSGGLGGGESTTYGATAAYTCSAHYTKTGGDPTCGASGSWSAAPTCTPVNCGTAPTVTNASTPTISGGLGGGSTTTYGATAAYGCDTGYVKTGPDSTCGSNGSWSTPPTCNPHDCGSPPTVSHAGPPTVSGGFGGGNSTTYNATASYTCDPGYGKSGGNPSCGLSGWGAAPTCAPVNCGAPPTVTNAGAPSVSGGAGGGTTTTYGATAAYTCNALYSKSGGDPTCLSTGSWSAAPTCAPINCGTPPVVSNSGAPSVTGGLGGGNTTTVNATAAYTCNPGYTVKTGSDPVCGSNGQWGAAPTCNPVDCGSPPVVANAGTPTVTGGAGGGSTTTYLATAAYSCNSGYTKVGADPSCAATALWGAAPTCAVPIYTDVVYRLTGQFRIGNTTGGMGNQTFGAPPGTPLGANATTPPFEYSGDSTPFTGNGTFKNGFARLRFQNDASGTPQAGQVNLVEWYFPLEFKQTAGATIPIDTDHSVGLLAPGLSNCDGAAGTRCSNHAPTISRPCAANAKGTLSGVTLAWDSCLPATNGQTSWNYSNGRAASGLGCASNWNSWGHSGPCSGFGCVFVNACSLGDAYQTWNQQLAALTFSSTTIKTATFTMPEIQIPNCSGASTTWLKILSATPIATLAGSTPGVDLVCNVQ